MNRLCLFLLIASSLLAQAPVTIPVTIISNITSPNQVFDNRSIQRQCNNTTFAVQSGTGAWSVRLEFSDTASSGPWTSFGSGATVTYSSPLSVGVGYGYHQFMRLNTTVGTTVAQLSCETNFWLPTGGGGGGGAGNPGGLPGDFQVNVGGTSFGGVTPPIPLALGGTGTTAPAFTCNNGVSCAGAFPFYTITATSPTIYAGTPYQEVPTGTLNGTNPTFTLTNTPNASTLFLFRNGVELKATVDYVLSASTITFQTGAIPQTGDYLLAFYQYGSAAVSGNATSINGLAVPANAVALTNSLSQIVNGSAAVKNVGNKAVLRDNQNALDNGNGSTTGIAGAITACGTTTPCAVLVPPSYPKTEQVPGTSMTNWFDGSAPSAITTSSNVTVYDQRYGGVNPTPLNCVGYNLPGNKICNIPQYDYIFAPGALSVFDNVGPQIIVTNALGGGVNQGGAGIVLTNKTNWTGVAPELNRWAKGQAEAFGGKINCYGIGDCLAESYQFYTWSGPNANSDESNELADREGFAGSDEPTGTVLSYTGSTLTISSWTYGQGHQGEGRYVIRENGGTISGAVTAISSPGTGPTVVTAGSFTASNVVGLLGTPTPVTLGVPLSVTVTPSFTVGNLGLIATSTQVCVADPDGGLEAVYPTAVTGTTFTATFRKVHPASAIIAAGGLSCTYGFSLTYENVTDSQNHLLAGTKIQTISGTLHNVIPIIYTDATHAYLYYATNGQWDTWFPLWNSANNGYVIYPMAEIVSVVNAGQVYNTLTLAPNNVPFAAADTIGIPHYFSMALLPGHELLESYWPNPAFNSGGLSFQYNQPMGINAGLFSLYNNTDPSLYANQILQPPKGISIYGYTQWAFNTQYAPAYWVIGVGCSSPGLLCAYPETMFNVANQDSSAVTPTGVNDKFIYDPYGSNEFWQWTTGAGNGTIYSMFDDHMDINGGALTLEEPTGHTQIGITMTGPFSIGLSLGNSPLYWALGVGCTAPCSSTATVIHAIAAFNPTLQDYVDYDQANKNFFISANSNSARYKFGATAFTTPWTTNGAGVDSATTQNYYSAENFVFGSVALPLSQPPCDITHVGWVSPAYYGTQASTVLYCTNRGGAYQWVNFNTGIESLSYATTLAFNGSVPSSSVTLTGNVTSFTISASPYGQIKSLTFCQDTTGGRTVAGVPSNLKGFVSPGTTPNTCSTQQFIQLLVPNEFQALNSGIQNVPI